GAFFIPEARVEAVARPVHQATGGGAQGAAPLLEVAFPVGECVSRDGHGGLPVGVDPPPRTNPVTEKSIVRADRLREASPPRPVPGHPAMTARRAPARTAALPLRGLP